MPTENKTSLSVYIITKNEADRIERCLESVSWADEIIVVDSGSTDKTTSIAAKYTDKIYHKEWKGFVQQKNMALELTSGVWVFNIDADEVVSDELRESIKQAVLQDDPQIGGYYVTRKINFMGKWILHSGWFPEYKIRLTRRSEGSWKGEEVHERLTVKSGRVEKLDGDLYHIPYRNVSDHLKTVDRYSTIGAQMLYKKGRRFKIMDLLLHPSGRFFKMIIIKRGFLDGFHGLILGCMGAFYVFLKYVKLWEIEQGESRVS